MFEANHRARSTSFDFAKLFAIFGRANFNPFEPRDERGWWSNTGGQANSASVYPAAYQGRFHDLVVDDFLAGLRARGSSVLKNVQVLGVNGVIAIPDGASKPKGSTTPYFLEMKTGNEPKFTPNQKLVYNLICLGGHATSFDSRIAQLGLTPGAPFPPMRIMLVVTSGPGQPIATWDYCRSIGLGVP